MAAPTPRINPTRWVSTRTSNVETIITYIYTDRQVVLCKPPAGTAYTPREVKKANAQNLLQRSITYGQLILQIHYAHIRYFPFGHLDTHDGFIIQAAVRVRLEEQVIGSGGETP